MNCIESIIEGQQVVIDNAYQGAGRYSVGTVVKVTKTRITVASPNGKNYQYNRRNGIEIGYGDSWSRMPKIATKYSTHGPNTLLSIEEANRLEQEAWLEADKKRLARAIRDANLSKFMALSVEELQAIADKIGVIK